MKSLRVQKPTIMVLVGVSGSGKSTLEANCLKDYPEIFTKLQQFSTRKMRPGETFGNPYLFVQRDTFDLFRPNLIGVIGCAENSLFKDKYGSLPDFVEGKIPTIILAEEGVKDLIAKAGNPNHPCSKYQIFVIGLDVRYEDLSEADRAARGRDLEFVAKERSVLDYADVTYANGNGKYVNPKDVVDHLLADHILSMKIIVESPSDETALAAPAVAAI